MQHASDTLTAAWRRAWRELDAGPNDALLATLLAAWSEPHRHYHTLQHLAECIAHLDAARGQAQRPAEAGLALWFHDAVYGPRRHDNEQRSADWARDSLLQAGVSRAAAQRVQAFVLATRHDAPALEPDARLVIDIDLAILGASRERFDEYERQVRLEYAHVPETDYRAGRIRILRAFAERPMLYATEFFRSRFEASARENLARSIASLR